MKYKISKQFFPWTLWKPAISQKFLDRVVPRMTPPKFFFRDKHVDVVRYEVASYDGAKIPCFLLH